MTRDHDSKRAIRARMKVTGEPYTRKVGALASLPGFGHQGFHPDHEGVSQPIGSWNALVFVVMLSPHRAGTGTIRAIPGSHRSAPELTGWGSAMPGHEPLKSLLVAGRDVGWGR